MPDSNGAASPIGSRRILITGANGQLGQALARLLASFGHDVTAANHESLDITLDEAVRDCLSRGWDYVVHCAALTDTARCEREPELAHAVNAIGTENVARSCAAQGSTLVAISTNEVFDGRTTEPYSEEDVPAPLNTYARSKLEGEQRALNANPHTLIVRTSWLYGAGGNNFVEKVRAAAASARQPLRFTTDEIAAPTSTNDLAHAITDLIHAMINARLDAASTPVQPEPGVYHLTNEGAASRYDWARAILELGHIDAEPQPVTTADLRASGYDGPLKPPYSVLANHRAAALGIRLRPWHDALADYMRSGVTQHG